MKIYYVQNAVVGYERDREGLQITYYGRVPNVKELNHHEIHSLNQRHREHQRMIDTLTLMENGQQMILSELFHDIDPIPQDDGPNAVCSIDYASDFEEAHGYLRAILKRNEKSGEKTYKTDYYQHIIVIYANHSYIFKCFLFRKGS